MLSLVCVAVSLTGVRAGIPLIIAYTLISMWTVHLLNALYLEYKVKRVRSPHNSCGMTVHMFLQHSLAAFFISGKYIPGCTRDVDIVLPVHNTLKSSYQVRLHCFWQLF